MILEGKRILVTGGTGSMGRVFVKRVLSGELGTPKKVIILSRDEAKQHDLRILFMNKIISQDDAVFRNFQNVLEFRVGDVRNYHDVCSAIKNVDIVINAAALKQVPTCEYFPYQAVYTNCIGAQNIVQAISENDFPVEVVVGISTDKAAKPVNVMGMSKAIQERIFTSANILNPKTRFICVRYGNVLASRGSVIPLFHKQIQAGGPVTVTMPEMTRFLLTLNQAVDTVFAALKHAEPGETFVPIAPSATVMDLAKAIVGNRKIEIKINGIRPGEKVHEIMISEEEIHHTVRKESYYAIKSMLPELQGSFNKADIFLKEEYSSKDSVIGFDKTIELLKRYNLLELSGENADELLR